MRGLCVSAHDLVGQLHPQDGNECLLSRCIGRPLDMVYRGRRYPACAISMFQKGTESPVVSPYTFMACVLPNDSELGPVRMTGWILCSSSSLLERNPR